MGVHNVEGRLTKCGGAVTMYTYPAWSFGGKHKDESETPGPGPGTVLPSTFNTIGPGFGPPRKPSTAPLHGPSTVGAWPKSERGASYSFGKRIPSKIDATPGPLHYNVPALQAKGSSPRWGAPPIQRPYTAPRPAPFIPPTIKSNKGQSFGLPYRPLHTETTPGPNAYQPNCAGCCMACNYGQGKTFGLRPPSFYEQRSQSPGPKYHVECSTIGAATQNCESGSSTFRAKRSV